MKLFKFKSLVSVAVVFSLALAAIITVSVAPALAAWQPSTYQETCTDISISGNVLSAKCKTLRGDFVNASIKLLGIENINGELTQTSQLTPSNFPRTCRSIGINKTTIYASCKSEKGDFVESSTEIIGIENNDGRLEYVY